MTPLSLYKKTPMPLSPKQPPKIIGPSKIQALNAAGK
jgi:hypothetical protein